MSADPPESPTNHERLQYRITDVQVTPGSTEPNCKFSARMYVDEELVCNLPAIDSNRTLQWSGLLSCDVSPTSTISLRLCKIVKDRPRYFNYPPFMVSEVDETGEVTLELPAAAWVVTIKLLTPEIAEQIFPNEVERFRTIEGTYDSHSPNTTVKYLFKHALKFASLVAKTMNERAAKVSFPIYMKIWELLDQQSELQDTVQAILRGLTCIGDILEIVDQASSEMLTSGMNRSKESIDGILALLEDVSVYILNQLSANHLASVSLEEEASSKFDIEAYLSRLKELQQAFNVSWPPPVVAPMGPYDDDEPSDTSEQEGPTRTIDPYEMLRLLRPMDPSGYDPRQACIEGTRVALLTKIMTWTQNRQSTERIMWISGQVGMGKTSVATSLCERLDGIRALASGFFCQQDDSVSSNPLWLINNLVHDIALRLPAYAQEVSETIRKNRKLCNSHLELRYNGLIKKPLQKLRSLSTRVMLVIVIDGLDECGDCDSREQILGKLYEMSQLVPWLRIIVTARPTGDIQDFFKQKCPREPIIQLQDHDASSDIRAYIESQVKRPAEKERWPSENINELCSMSHGVFLWAVLAIKYIKKSGFPALPRLQKLLSDQKSPVSGHFDTLYTRALSTAIDDAGDDIKDVYLRCIGAILAISEQEPLAVPDLQHLLLVAAQIDELTLEHTIKNLSPLLLVMDGKRIKFHHPSFRDFLTSASRSGPFHIRLDQYEAEPATCCLRIMQRDLRFNICQLETSHRLNSEVPDLKARIDSHIGQALKYACTHWVDHFIASPSQDLANVIKDFMEGPQLMYWIETLSLLGRLDLAITELSKLAELELNQFDDWNLIVSWAKDAHRFIISFYDAITASTPHLYVSALALAPRKSLMALRMRPHFPNSVMVARGDSDWHPCVKTVVHPYAVHALSISPDGKWIITGYPDGSLAMWDKQTGTCASRTLTGHRDTVTCVTFSPNGNFVASSSHEATIRVWDVTKALQDSRVLSGHSGPVHSVAFSPNSSLIASGSSDKTIRLWDPITSRLIHEPYVGHQSRVTSVAFSPDGAKLVSGSWDKTIRVWPVDISNSRLASNPLVITGHSDSVTCVAFSPNGSKIASGSADKTVQVWNAQTGAKSASNTSSAKHLDLITCLAFSPNGKYLASCSLDGAIQQWDAVTSTAYSEPFGHHSPVNVLAFSPDGRHIVSGSTDMTTRVWEVDARLKPKPLAAGPLVGHTARTQTIAISANGNLIVSGCDDHKVRIWDAQTGAPVGNPLTGHSGAVNCVLISPDGSQVLSASDDRFIKLWDIATYTNTKSYQHNASIRCMAYSPDDTQIAFSGDDHKVYLWDLTGWKMIKDGLQGHSSTVYSVAYSPDGTCVASGSADKTVILWDTRSHSHSGSPLSGHTHYVRSVAFSPCSSQLVSGGSDHMARVWDRQTGNIIHVLAGHTNEVLSVSFSPDGSCIASGSCDKTLRLWNAKTGQLIGQPLTGHTQFVWPTVFSPDGNYLISGSDDKTIRIWNIASSRPAVGPEIQPPYSSADPESQPPNSFCWPANPYDLSPHPNHPGWVTQDQKSLVLWLPTHYEQRDRFLDSSQQTPGSPVCLDYSKFVHGTKWTKIACDSIRNRLESD